QIAFSSTYTNGEAFNVISTDAHGVQSSSLLVNANDTTAPVVPTAVINQDGNSILGLAEANSIVRALNANGQVLATAQAAAEGNYQLLFETALTNGEVIKVIAIDSSGNQSPAVAVTASDTTAPDAPTAVMNEQGFRVIGFAEAGSVLVIKNSNN